MTRDLSPSDFHATLRCMGFTETLGGLYVTHPELPCWSLPVILRGQGATLQVNRRATMHALKRRLDLARAGLTAPAPEE